LETFYDKVDELIALVKSTPCAPGLSEILLPGEAALRRELANQKIGVDIDHTIWSSLTELAGQLTLKNIPASLYGKHFAFCGNAA